MVAVVPVPVWVWEVHDDSQVAVDEFEQLRSAARVQARYWMS